MTQAVRAQLRRAAANDESAVSNAGLELDRWLTDTIGGENRALKRLYERVSRAQPPETYRPAFERWRAALGDLRYVVMQEFEAQGRMIVGIGAESTLETAISLNRLYGMPFIPGSALKGLARKFAEVAVAQRESTHTMFPGNDHHAVLFGAPGGAAYLSYLDAWYVPGSAPKDRPLVQDVMTVHHPDYYGSGDAQGPGPWDFDDPNPVPFMSARGRYLVAVRGPTAAWAKLALEILARALVEWGVGAKTSSGYGRLRAVGIATDAPRPSDSAVAVPPSTATAHPLVREIAALPPAQVKPRINAFYQQCNALPEPARREVAEAIKQRLEAAGILRDKNWAARGWVQELQAYLAE